MIYRHNNIFKDKNHALAKYVHDISICVDMDNTVTSSCPILVVKLLRALINPDILELTIEVSLDDRSESKSVSFSGLESGSLYTKSKDGVSVMFSTPASGECEIKQPVELYPYIVSMSVEPPLTDSTDSATPPITITIPAEDIDVHVGVGEVYLSLKSSYLDRNETNSEGFLFINGISPGADGNINIKSKSSAVVVSVSADDDGGTDV